MKMYGIGQYLVDFLLVPPAQEEKGE